MLPKTFNTRSSDLCIWICAFRSISLQFSKTKFWLQENFHISHDGRCEEKLLKIYVPFTPEKSDAKTRMWNKQRAKKKVSCWKMLYIEIIYFCINPQPRHNSSRKGEAVPNLSIHRVMPQSDSKWNNALCMNLFCAAFLLAFLACMQRLATLFFSARLSSHLEWAGWSIKKFCWF